MYISCYFLKGDNWKQRLKLFYRKLTPKTSFKPLFRVTSAAVILAFSSNAYAGPFECDGDIFQVQSGQLRIFDTALSSYVDVGVPQGAYNAVGFNTLDNFAYGAQGTNVIRIHADGTIENVLSSGFNSFSGDVDDNNTLWLRRAANRYIGIDLATGAQTDITFTGNIQNVADVAYFEVGGDRLLIGFGNGIAGIFNLDDGTANRIAVPGLPTNGAFGATWTDFNGRLFTFHNNTGQIFEVFDITSAAPSSVLVAQGDPSNSNDGFSCPAAPFPNLPPLAQDDDYVTPIDIAVTSNVLGDNGNGPDEDPENSPLTVNTSPLLGPSNGTVVLNADGSFTYTPNSGFIGTDVFTYEITDPQGLPATAIVTIIIEGADITITKTPSITQDANIGDLITYTYIVENTGNVSLTNVHVTDAHSGSGDLSAITPSSVTLPPGQTQNFTSTYTVTQTDVVNGGSITNTATANGTSDSAVVPQPTADAQVDLIIPAPSLSMIKVADNAGPYTVGDIITYTYTVTNDGNQVVRDIAINDAHNGSGPAPIPSNETLLTDVAPIGDSVDITSDGSWDQLAPGDVLIFTGTYTVTATDAQNL